MILIAAHALLLFIAFIAQLTTHPSFSIVHIVTIINPSPSLFVLLAYREALISKHCNMQKLYRSLAQK